MIHMLREVDMSQLVVRNVAPELVAALRLRAARKGRSMEAEHREILQEALGRRSRGRNFKEALLAMPDIGEDTDFERRRHRARRVRL
jgi:plasmid stability protein